MLTLTSSLDFQNRMSQQPEVILRRLIFEIIQHQCRDRQTSEKTAFFNDTIQKTLLSANFPDLSNKKWNTKCQKAFCTSRKICKNRKKGLKTIFLQTCRRLKFFLDLLWSKQTITTNLAQKNILTPSSFRLKKKFQF